MSSFSYAESLLNEIESNEDGNFRIVSEGGFALLTVNKGGKNGKAVRKEDVIARMKLYGIEKYDNALLEKIIKESDGKEHKIAEWTGSAAVDATLSLEISEDKMHAFLTMHPPRFGGKQVSIEEATEFLKQNGVKFGIDEHAVVSIINESKYLVKTLVATGRRPTNGTHGYIRILFDYSGKPKLASESKGKVDYKNIHVIQSVNAGDMIAEKVEPNTGEIGMNVLGEEIPNEKGISGEWKLGTNCRLSDDKLQLFATLSGRPVFSKDGTIGVDEVCQLENVDYSTGNVDFPGTVVVEGSVADNFTLRTQGSLYVKKSVGRVFLYAEKDIYLSGGVMGRNGGFIEAGGNIYARFIEQGTVKAKGSIYIESSSFHSDLTAGDSIFLQGERGELIGGNAIAGKSVEASKIGAVVETKTDITVGLPPEIVDELKKMKQEIINREDTLKKIKQSLHKMNETIAAKKDLSIDDKSLLKKLIELEKRYTEGLISVKKDYETVSQEYDSPEHAFVSAEKFIYPKVNISFGRGKTFSTDIRTIDGKVFVYLNSEGLPHTNNIPPAVKKDKK